MLQGLLDRFLAEDNLRRFYIAQVMLYGGTFIVISACVCCDSMGGEDTDPFKGKGPKKGTPEYDRWRRELEKIKRGGGAGTPEDIQ